MGTGIEPFPTNIWNLHVWHWLWGDKVFKVKCFICGASKVISVLFLYMCDACSVAKFCPALCDPPGSSVHGISQARILEQVAMSFPRVSSWSRESNLCLLYLPHWQADSLPLHYPGSPVLLSGYYTTSFSCCLIFLGHLLAGVNHYSVVFEARVYIFYDAGNCLQCLDIWKLSSR